jgi:iron(II)-dependent oxidoreductase
MTQLSEEMTRARAQTDALFSAIDPAALYDRPIPERHRIIFYLGHLEAFDANQLRSAAIVAESTSPAFDKLFELGIDPEPGQLPSDKAEDWPSVMEVKKFGAANRALVDQHLSHAPTDIAEMMIEHRHMHAETLAYMLHNLDYGKKSGPPTQLHWEAPVTPEMVRIPAGEAILGRKPEDGFGWDNEFMEHGVLVPEFSIGKYKVTNGEYLEFVKERDAATETVPHYWVNRGGQWFWRGMFEEIPLPLNWPVYATLDQARAYAASRGAEIPTEAQYHRAAPQKIESDANLDYKHWDPVPVAPSEGVSQMVGNGWEWTSSVFAPFEGFTPHPSYTGYSANFFDGKHYVIKGASPRTAMKLVRRSFRNWFRPEYPHAYATFRLCQP